MVFDFKRHIGIFNYITVEGKVWFTEKVKFNFVAEDKL